ncbi:MULTISPECIES: pyrimidine 5'-nucleotidase [Vibrio]|uniref:pyrimidine 5'-nucleotidase n=1 Tax=Vibrio TaxID=662 RepID=UPI000C162A9C|nr:MULTISPECIES: pyrimidine 5'-nucleotidase [Vibrio]NAW69604.1 pyrimidine 5'-nucleotidase [Vibrio sp. V28_P6S34P95]NAX04006.1 pyrimidine 5'-nucleotidase [Vibrio sp. V30_P3S12P165]NAX34860.1 pyrimidine 5'-nucleotidase [Vibrio sp. V29_P1S30P107]NAX37526.1 pyrimidine 5'-nucleotidase [Vibrio sp. V27_P1S3P104]NAX41283.1 pyrimidine 5'-nucleotidase [Vibrio sp. V26_P1S5P106]
MKYDWILFDADETLFHFDAFKGMQLMFARKGVDFTEQDFHQYQQVNKPLWVDYQNGDISAEQLKHIRFTHWAEQLETTTTELNSAFLTAMADICTLLPGAQELLDGLKGKAKLGIITNGFTELQDVRLAKTGMTDYFEHIVISEQVGIAKPDAGIFAHAMERMGHPSKEKVLMVGDNPHSDILGGLNFGFETCWLNTHQHPCPEGINAHYEVASLYELQTILLA